MEKEIFATFSRYNRWMNGNLLTACAQLSDEERHRPMGVPFDSIHGIWNHLLVADHTWLARFRGEPLPYTSLSHEVCSDFEALRQERATTDEAIATFVATLKAERLAQPFTFAFMASPASVTLPFHAVVMQLFNHQTHHRGQITALVEQLGGDCGVTDLVAMVRAETSNST